jgi:arsenite-transporting ATPase
VEDGPDGPVLVVGLPQADADELDVTIVGDDLVVTLGALRRSLPLPQSLRRREVRSARFEAGELRVRFDEPST